MALAKGATLTRTIVEPLLTRTFVDGQPTRVSRSPTRVDLAAVEFHESRYRTVAAKAILEGEVPAGSRVLALLGTDVGFLAFGYQTYREGATGEGRLQLRGGAALIASSPGALDLDWAEVFAALGCPARSTSGDLPRDELLVELPKEPRTERWLILLVGVAVLLGVCALGFALTSQLTDLAAKLEESRSSTTAQVIDSHYLMGLDVAAIGTRVADLRNRLDDQGARLDSRLDESSRAAAAAHQDLAGSIRSLAEDSRRRAELVQAELARVQQAANDTKAAAEAAGRAAAGATSAAGGAKTAAEEASRTSARAEVAAGEAKKAAGEAKAAAEEASRTSTRAEAAAEAAKSAAERRGRSGT